MTQVPAPPKRYSEEAVRQILGRALQLETATGITRNELESIATEIGIDPVALASAVDEYDAESDAARSLFGISVRHPLASLFGVGLCLGGVAAVGSVAFGLPALSFAPIGLGAALMISVILSLRERRTQSLPAARSFLASNLALLGGLTAATFVTAFLQLGYPLDQVPTVFLTKAAVLSWATSSVLGVLVVLRRVRSHSQNPEQPQEAWLGRARRLVAQALRSLADRLAKTRAERFARRVA